MFQVFSVVTPGTQPPGFRSMMASLSPVSMSNTCNPAQGGASALQHAEALLQQAEALLQAVRDFSIAPGDL